MSETETTAKVVSKFGIKSGKSKVRVYSEKKRSGLWGLLFGGTVMMYDEYVISSPDDLEIDEEYGLSVADHAYYQSRAWDCVETIPTL